VESTLPEQSPRGVEERAAHLNAPASAPA
jgi:hypothetical protein